MEWWGTQSRAPWGTSSLPLARLRSLRLHMRSWPMPTGGYLHPQPLSKPDGCIPAPQHCLRC